MDAWITPLVLAAVLAALCPFLLPEGGKRLTRVTEFAVSLVTLAVLFRPLSAALPALADLRPGDLFPSVTPEGSAVDPDTWDTVTAAVNAGIEADLSARFRPLAGHVRAEADVRYADGELAVTALSLTVSGAGRTVDLVTLKEYAEEAYACPCRIGVTE